jgi:hypothetical protein
MPHTPGPWAYDPSTNHVVSTTEFEEWSRDIDDDPPVPKRIICTFAAMGDNNVENLALIVASPTMLEALKLGRTALANWIEIQDEEDARDSDQEALAAMDAAIEMAERPKAVEI